MARVSAEDVLRAVEQGIRSFLVADLGLLVTLRKAQARGDLPEAIVWKVSAAMALEWLDRLSPGLSQSKPGAAGLGVPV